MGVLENHWICNYYHCVRAMSKTKNYLSNWTLYQYINRMSIIRVKTGHTIYEVCPSYKD